MDLLVVYLPENCVKVKPVSWSVTTTVSAAGPKQEASN